MEKLTAENFTSQNFWRNWEGYEWTARRFEVADLHDWHPAFGTIRPSTLGVIAATFTEQEIARLQFATYQARTYQLNEG